MIVNMAKYQRLHPGNHGNMVIENDEIVNLAFTTPERSFFAVARVFAARYGYCTGNMVEDPENFLYMPGKIPIWP